MLGIRASSVNTRRADRRRSGLRGPARDGEEGHTFRATIRKSTWRVAGVPGRSLRCGCAARPERVGWRHGADECLQRRSSPRKRPAPSSTFGEGQASAALPRTISMLCGARPRCDGAVSSRQISALRRPAGPTRSRCSLKMRPSAPSKYLDGRGPRRLP